MRTIILIQVLRFRIRPNAVTGGDFTSIPEAGQPRLPLVHASDANRNAKVKVQYKPPGKANGNGRPRSCVSGAVHVLQLDHPINRKACSCSSSFAFSIGLYR
jgi:hypothetical protein